MGLEPKLRVPPDIPHARSPAPADTVDRERFVFGDYFFRSTPFGTAQVTVAAQLDGWLSTQRVAPSTAAGYASAIRSWKKAIGDTSLHALTHSQVLRALAVRTELNGKTVNNYLAALRQAMALAVRDKILSDSPVDGVPRSVWQRTAPDPFTRGEVEQIVAAMPEGQIRNLVEWRFFSGVRTSEMAGLKWEHVDLVNARVRISGALVRGAERDMTKTGVVRHLVLNSRAMSALYRQQELRGDRGAAVHHVWTNPRSGTAWSDERAFRRGYWIPTLKRLGIRYRPPNNARHTYATMMLMAGRTPAWCARQLGHSVEVFLRTYARWLDGAQDDRELAGLEDWLTGDMA